MIALLIIVIITISLAAGIGYSIISLIKSGEVSLGIQKTQTQMLQMSQLIGGSIQTNSLKNLIPVVTVDGKVSNEVPSFIPFKRTAYDKKITYCPVAPTGNEYAIENFNGQEYITTGAPSSLDAGTLAAIRSANVVAYLLAPAPNTETDMMCNEISLGSSGSFNLITNGGFAVPVFANIKGNTTYEVESAEELTSALNEIAYNRPYDSTINFKTNISATSDAINNIISQLDGRHISFVSKNGSAALNLTGSPIPLEITGIVTIENIKITGTMPLTQVRQKGVLEITNSEVGPLSTDMGDVLIGDNSYVYGTASNPPVTIAGGNVKINSTATVVPLSAPAFKLNGGTLFVSGTPNIMHTAGSSITDYASQTATVIGGGRITGNKEEISFAIAGHSTNSVTISPLPKVTKSCSDEECIASCSAYGSTAKILYGSCEASDIEPLIGTKIDQETNAYSCKWGSAPIVGSHKATAICGY